MTKSDGKCRIDAVAIGEVAINLLGAQPAFAVKFALVNSDTTERFGAGNRNTGWSEETMGLLEALIESAERDLCRAVFNEGVLAQPSTMTHDEESDGIPAL